MVKLGKVPFVNIFLDGRGPNCVDQYNCIDREYRQPFHTMFQQGTDTWGGFRRQDGVEEFFFCL